MKNLLVRTALAGTIVVTSLAWMPDARGEVPLRSKERLTKSAGLIVVGEVREVYTATQKSPNWIDTKSVAEIIVREVEKGQGVRAGDVVYAHYWNKRWTGRGNPPPGSNGHIPTAKGQRVRAYLVRKDGVQKAILPNGLAKLKNEPTLKSPGKGN